MITDQDILFEVNTPLGFSVRATKEYWQIITERKHPVMREKRDLVEASLTDPIEIRRSKVDPSVYLFYGKERSKRCVLNVGCVQL